MRAEDHETERDRPHLRSRNQCAGTEIEKVTHAHKQIFIYEVLTDEFDDPHFYKCRRCDVIGSYVGSYPYCASCNWDSLTDPCSTFCKGDKR